MRTTPREITCPTCGKVQEIPCYGTINVTAEPALKAKVLARAINQADCINCRSDLPGAADFLYNDRTRNYMIWHRPDGGSTGDPAGNRRVRLDTATTTLRIVHDYDALVEKIRIFDNQLDDCMIEFLKASLWPGLSSRRTEIRAGDGIRLLGLSWPTLRFEASVDGETKCFTYPYEEYLKCAQPVAPARSRITRGAWCVVDRAFVTQYALAGGQPLRSGERPSQEGLKWEKPRESRFWGRIKSALHAEAR